MRHAPALRVVSDGRRREPKRMRFTKNALDALRLEPTRRQLWVFDDMTPHLAVMVTDKGAASFYWYGRNVGRPVKYRIGSVDDLAIDQARRKAAALTVQNNDGVDLMDSKRDMRRGTLGDLWDRFDAEHSAKTLRPSSRAVYASMWKNHLARWKHRPAANLTVDQVAEMHRRISATSRVVANRAIGMLRSMLNWARVEHPIKPRVVRWNAEQHRERFLSAVEVRALLTAIEAADRDAADFLKVLLFTGMRRGNVLGMTWAELDLDTRTWTIPPAKAKGKRTIVVHLSDVVTEVLNRRKSNQDEYVFPAPRKIGRHMIAPVAEWRRIKKAAGIEDCRLHDLRHTIASWLAAGGSSLLTIGKVLGHASPQATQRYAHLVLDGVRPQVDAVAAAMTGTKTEAAKRADER